MKSPSLLAFLGIVSTTIVVNACNDARAQTPVSTNGLRDALTRLASGEGDLAPLTVTFDHLHALHGGLQLTIRGDGTVAQRALRTKAGETKDKVILDDLKRLVALLVKHEVWTQRVDKRQPVPDESRVTLKTCYRDECVEIREWYNDLDKNARIGDVLKFMQTVAWKPPTPEFWYSEMSNTLPADVRGLFDAAWKMKKEADAKCNSR